MLITKLKGVHVRQYSEIDIEFKEGLININGTNGAGKSTIMSLIELALFGNIKEIKAEEIKNFQAKKGQKWELELTFIKDGNEYTVVRNEVTAKAKLFVNNKLLIDGGQKVVTDHIVQKVLRMDQESFINAFYAKQDDLDRIIKMKPEQRKKEVSKLLRIDKIDKSIESLRKDKNRLITILDEKSRHIKGEEYFSQAEEELNNSLQNLKELNEKQEELTKEQEKKYQAVLVEKEKMDGKYEEFQRNSSTYRERVQEKKQLIEIVLNNIQSELKEVEKSKEEISELEKALIGYDALAEKLENMQKVQILYAQKKQLVQHIDALKTRLTNKKERIEKLKVSILEKDFMTEMETIDNNVSDLEKVILGYNNEIVDLKGKLSYVINEGKRLKNERTNLKTLGAESPCPICKREMGEHFHSLSNEYNQSLNELTNEHRKISEEIKLKDEQKIEKQNVINNLKKEKSIIESKHRNNIKLKDEFSMMQQDFQEDKKGYLEIESKIKEMENIEFDEKEFNELNTTFKVLQQKKERFNLLRNLVAKEPKLLIQEQEIENKIQSLIKELSDIEVEIKNLNFNLEVYKNFQSQINLEVETLRNAEKQLSFTKEQYSAVNVKIELLKKERNENENKAKELEDKKHELAVLIKSEDILKNYKIKRLSKARPKIEKIMQNLLAFTTDGKYDLVELDEHYNIFVYRNGLRKPLHLYSGGEQKLVALCMRLAISRVLVSNGEHENFEYLALDEVLGSMDEGRQNTIIDALRRLNSFFKQIFIITHNPNIKELFDYTLQVQQENDLTSKAFWLSRDEELEEYLLSS